MDANASAERFIRRLALIRGSRVVPSHALHLMESAAVPTLSAVDIACETLRLLLGQLAHEHKRDTYFRRNFACH